MALEAEADLDRRRFRRRARLPAAEVAEGGQAGEASRATYRAEVEAPLSPLHNLPGAHLKARGTAVVVCGGCGGGAVAPSPRPRTVAVSQPGGGGLAAVAVRRSVVVARSARGGVAAEGGGQPLDRPVAYFKPAK